MARKKGSTDARPRRRRLQTQEEKEKKEKEKKVKEKQGQLQRESQKAKASFLSALAAPEALLFAKDGVPSMALMGANSLMRAVGHETALWRASDYVD